jgi:tRNA U34 5-carboxymethylaminomethyl modifying GTPase MnmE/TrmE
VAALDARQAEIGQAVEALEDLLGRRTNDEVLDQVFRDFCIGK